MRAGAGVWIRIRLVVACVIATALPPRQRTPLESPTWAIVSVDSSTSATTAVVPSRRPSRFAMCRKSVSTSWNACHVAVGRHEGLNSCGRGRARLGCISDRSRLDLGNLLQRQAQVVALERRRRHELLLHGGGREAGGAVAAVAVVDGVQAALGQLGQALAREEPVLLARAPPLD